MELKNNQYKMEKIMKKVRKWKKMTDNISKYKIYRGFKEFVIIFINKSLFIKNKKKDII